MHMKIASLLIAAQVAGAQQQLHSAPGRQLGRGKKRKSSKNPTPLELRFGPQLSQEKVAKTFDKLTNSTIVSYGLQNFATPDFSTPLIDTFRTRGQLAISYEEVESVCVTQCYNNPACKTVAVFDCGCNELEEKPQYNCDFFNPDLGPGAYITNKELSGPSRNVYTKKAGNTVIPSHDEVACDISASNAASDISKYYTDCLFGTNSTCVAELELTDDFKDYVLPATNCLALKGGDLINCLTCLSSTNGASDICTANNETNVIRGTCKDECYEVPLDDGTNNTLNLSACEPALQASLLCFDGSPEYGAVNRKNNTTPFACPE